MPHLGIEIMDKDGVLRQVVKPANSSSQSKKIMGDNVATLSFELNKMVNFQIGDTAEIFGETYKLNRMPVVTKKSLYNYEYTLVMQALQSDLVNAQFMFYDSQNVLQEGDFSLTGTATVFIDLIVTNMNRISSGWQRGGVIETDYKTLDFAKEDCLSVLQKIATAFNTEFYIKGQFIHLAKLQTHTPWAFKYGRSKGLYDITRTQPDGQRIITRLYAFGSEKNLPENYSSSRLRLPGGSTHLITNLTWNVTGLTYTFYWTFPTLSSITSVLVEYRRLGSSVWHNYDAGSASSAAIPFPGTGTFEVQFSSYAGSVLLSTTPIVQVTDTSTVPVFSETFALPYLEAKTALYGIREGDYITEDIYPHRTGTVTSVDALNIYTLVDAGMDFDINHYLVPGVAVKINFVSGQLSGYAFDISRYDPTLKKFTIIRNKDEKTFDVPSPDLRPAIGDKYVLTDIYMPQSYVLAAEQELQTKAQEFLKLNCEPSYQYTITCDPAYFRKKNIKMDIGNVVWLTDIELNVDKYIRVIGLTKSLVDEFEYTLELGEYIVQGSLATLATVTYANTTQIAATRRAFSQNKLLNGVNVGNLQIDQGTLIITSIPTGTGTPLKIDANGKLCI